MADNAKRGLDKQHKVLYPDGTEGTMSQRDWKARDKSLGIQRVDEDEAVVGAPETPVEDGAEGESPTN